MKQLQSLYTYCESIKVMSPMLQLVSQLQSLSIEFGASNSLVATGRPQTIHNSCCPSCLMSQMVPNSVTMQPLGQPWCRPCTVVVHLEGLAAKEKWTWDRGSAMDKLDLYAAYLWKTWLRLYDFNFLKAFKDPQKPFAGKTQATRADQFIVGPAWYLHSHCIPNMLHFRAGSR